MTDGEWNWAEDADDAETRQGYATVNLLNDLPAGKSLRFYRGPNAAGNGAQSGWMTGSGRVWALDAVNAVDPGVRDYAAIYMQNTDGTGPIVQVSTIKSFVASNVPSKSALPSVVAGTVQTGDVVIDPSNTAPAANGRPIIEYGYSVDGDAIIALPGGNATTARTVSILNTVAVQVRVHSRNVNGWSVGSDPVSVTPPVITAGSNTKLPVLTANIYGGGAWVLDFGEWSGGVTLTGDVEQSDDGVTGWTTYAANVAKNGGKWPTSSMAGKYVRGKVTPSTGSPAYSAVIGPLKAGLDRVHSSRQPMQYLYRTITALPFNLATGVWFTGLFYYNGISWEGYPFVLTSNTNPARGLFCSMNAAGLTGQTTITFVNESPDAVTPANPGWYRQTYHFYSQGGQFFTRFLRNDQGEVKRVGTGGSVTPSAWTQMRFYTRTNAGADVYYGNSTDFAIGTGDPTAMHEWLSANTLGAMGAVADYDFAGDPACDITSHWLIARLGSATWDAADIVDTKGVITGPWTATNYGGGGTNTNWTAKKPGYIDASSPISPVPEAYLSPAFGNTEDTYSIQSGTFGSVTPDAPAWQTGYAYGIGNRVKVGATVYRCVVPHTSGATFAGDSARWTTFTFTINSLTHSVLGNILPNMIGNTFPGTTAGIVTASVTVGSVISAPAAWAAGAVYTAASSGISGSRVNVGGVYYECVVAHTGESFTDDLKSGFWQFQYGTITSTSEIFQALAIPPTPRLADRFGGAALVCAIEQYPNTPSATSFESIAALKTAIDGLAAGSTLTVDDIGDFSTILTLTPKDYGGVTIQAKNPEGIKVLQLVANGCQNITLRGFAAAEKMVAGQSGMSGNILTNGVWFDHCRASGLQARGISSATSTFRLTNFLTWDLSIDGRNNTVFTSKVVGFKRATLQRFGFGRIADANILVVSNIAELIMDRYIIWDGAYTGTTHADMFQTVPGGIGVFAGMIRNGFVFDVKTGDENGFQGIFMTDCSLANLQVKNNIVRAAAPNNLIMSGNRYNVRMESNSGGGIVATGSAMQGAVLIKNNVKSSSGAIIEKAVDGVEESTLAIGSSGLQIGDVFPDWNTYPNSWRAFRPAFGYETRGAGALYAELEAKRVALGM